ncbi:MAG: hypothetical protein ACOYOA_12450 [Saprospiraceae bacterium]
MKIYSSIYYFSAVKYLILFLVCFFYHLCLVSATAKADTTDILLIVNGYWGKQKYSPSKCNLKCYWQYDSIQSKPIDKWNYNQHQVKLFFAQTAQYFNTDKFVFIDGGNFTVNKKAKIRAKRGYRFAKSNLSELIMDCDDKTLIRFHFLTHSMGAAYAEGLIKYIISNNMMVGKVLHLAPSEASDIRTFRNAYGPSKRIQIISESDKVVKMVNRWHFYRKDNVVAQIKDTDLFACFYESEVTRPQAGDIQHALHMRKLAYDIIYDIEKINFCGDENCIILEELSNKIPYRKICKDGVCAQFIPKKGYFIKI